MHNIGSKEELLNYGVFIGVIIDELEKQLENTNTDININESKVKNEKIKTGLIPHQKKRKIQKKFFLENLKVSRIKLVKKMLIIIKKN